MLAAAVVTASCGAGGASPQPAPPAPDGDRTVSLPAPRTSGPRSLEEVVAERRSVRTFTGEALTVDEIGQLLWAAQGTTEAGGRGRAAPSAGGTYPLELYVVTSQSVARYLPEHHAMQIVSEGDLRRPLAEAALGQDHVAEAAAVIVIGAVYARTEERYGDRAQRYVLLEAGHAAQNVLLQAVALGLGAVPVGAFDDLGVRRVLGLPADHQPLYLIPIGHPAGE